MTTALAPALQAAFKPETQEVTVVPKGVGGPWCTYPAATRDEAIEVLHKHGFLVGSDWDEAHGVHWVSVTEI